MAKPVVITLNVQANTLFNMANPSQSDVDNCCSITDNNGGSSNGGGIESYTTPVFINFNVMWNGATNDQGYSVAISSIVYEPDSSDKNFFDNNTLTGSGGRSGNVNANVRNDNSLMNQHDDYAIYFKVYNSGNSYKSFSIDPKIQVNS